MTNLDRVALEIKDVGLYNLILQDVERVLGKKRLTKEEIKDALLAHPEIYEEYKQTNVEYNLSNIHLKNINLENLKGECKDKALKVNQNLDTIREIEKYTLDFEHSSVLVIIFSVEFFVLFSVQYFIVLLSLKAYQWYIYGVFALSIVAAWLYAKKEKKKYKILSEKFYKLYDETLLLIDELESKRCIKKEDLWITESDEHI